jgi:TP901 family phage tail tape measure protein
MGVLTKGLIAAGVIVVAKEVTQKITEMVNIADEYQKSLSNVATVIDTTKISLSGLSASVLRMSPALGNSTQLMNAMYQTFSSGAASLEEAMNITENAAMFSKAALTDATKSVDVLTTAINAYGKDVVTAEQASDIFFQTVKLGKLTGEELAGSIGQSIPLFASSGIKLEELAAGMAAMTQQGITAHQSTTQLNSIVNAFLKPSEAMIALLGKLGYESGSAFLKTEGLAGGLKILEDATGGDAAELAKLIPELNGMKGAMALTGQGGKLFVASLDAMNSAAGSTTTAFEKQRKVFDTAKASWTNLQTVVGNIAVYFADDLVASTGTVAQNLQQFLTSGQGMDFFAESAGFVAGAFSAIEAVAKPIIKDIMPGFKEIGKSVSDVMATLAEKTGTNVSAFNLFGVYTQYLSSMFRIWSKLANEVIQQLGRTAIAAVESGKTVGVFFDYLAKKKTWDDVKTQASATGEAFKGIHGRYRERGRRHRQGFRPRRAGENDDHRNGICH